MLSSLFRTHLGHLLRPGDVALGYDLRNSNANDAEFEKMKRCGVRMKRRFGILAGSNRFVT